MSLKKGDQVEWESSQGKVKGTVEKKLTKATMIKTHKVAATPEEPQFLVRRARTGAKAAHKEEALKNSSSKKSKDQ